MGILAQAPTAIANLPVASIVPGNNDRKAFDPEALETLAASIREHGLAQPITVRPLGDKFQITCGERRFRAISEVLGWSEAPCIVRQLTDSEASAIMLTENTARVDLNPIEEARAYQSRIDSFGSALEEVARVAGVSTERVRRRLALLRLVDEAQHLVSRSLMPLGHAEAMAALDENRQRIALRVLQAREGLPLTTFRQVVGNLMAEQSQGGLFDLETFWLAQVEAGVAPVKRGKRAITGAPKRADLPPVNPKQSETTGDVLDRYIAQLMALGLEAEAATLGTVYEALVHANFMNIACNPQLLGAKES